MNKNLLLTVSFDREALYGVRFVEAFFQNKPSVGLTLLNIGEAAGPDEPGSEADRQAARGRGQALLEDIRRGLVDKGFLAENINIKFTQMQDTAAEDILREGVVGGYDSVVLGRRGLSRLDELLVEESVSKTLVTREMDVPIWVCRSPDPGRKNVLLAVDGSEESLRAAGQAGLMLADEPGHVLDILHVWNPLRESDLEAERVLDLAKSTALLNGTPKERISTILVRGAAPAKAVIREAEQGAYAVVAVGRTGSDRKPKRLFMGSVSLKLLRTLERETLWISH
ncbi:MAG: universal stress protein [Desulfovibrionaceae bacterium]|nr:universal stress protein [Desulfovibrionaceae bacterium]